MKSTVSLRARSFHGSKGCPAAEKERIERINAMKKMTAIVCLLCLLLSSCGNGSAAGGNAGGETAGTEAKESGAVTDNGNGETPAEEFEWENTSGGVEITGYKGNSTRVVVPELIGSKKVVSVGNTFSGNVLLEELVLPEGVERTNLSGCKALKYFEARGRGGSGSYVPASVEELILPELGWFAFEGDCSNDALKKLDISTATTIEFYENCVVPSELAEVKISEEIDYYHEYGDGSIEGLYTTKGEIEDWRFAIDDSNRAEIYCKAFGKEKITVNGVLYEGTPGVDYSSPRDTGDFS